MDNKLTLNMQLDTNILNKNELQIANIGDSGFLVIRFKNGEPYCPFKSKE